jgi:hypothetical protein
LSFAGVYPHYINKVERKGHTKEELDIIICGYRVEEIEDKLMQKVRYLDKLVDELAKGRTMDKILRSFSSGPDNYTS